MQKENLNIKKVENKRTKKAFSLMELMIVIIILGLLAGLIMPNLVGKGEEAKQKLVCIQMESIGKAVKMFKIDFGRYPSNNEGLKALIENPNPEEHPNYTPYLDKKSGVPADPWSNPYIYLLNEEDNSFDLVSLGANGKEGGKEENRDIYYSKCTR